MSHSQVHQSPGSGVQPAQQIPACTEVAIIGYGPVGAALAAYLGKLGIRTLVIEKTQDILPMPRAIALDNEALRVLQLVGLEEKSFEKIVIKKVKMHSPYLGEFAEINTSGQVDELPRLVTFYQPELEAALRCKVQQYPHVQVATSTEFVEFQEHADSIKLCVRGSDGSLKWIDCKYMVGADGASSRIRELIGQAFTGQTYVEDWLIVDAGQREGKAIDHVEFICDPNRPTPHMPAPGGRERWEFMLQKGETREEMEQPEKIRQLLTPWIDTEQLHIERKAVYRFHARCCNSFQKGRVFLAGDAAHITPPFVGQGLVAGLRDIANLGWKLAWVLQGKADERILSSYDTERRPHAKKMIELAKVMGHLVMPGNRLKAIAVHAAIKSLCRLPLSRDYLTELKIKPHNKYGKGLFIKKFGKQYFAAGGQIEQVRIKSVGNESIDNSLLSDDVLGDTFTMIGLGVDPRLYIDSATYKQWQQHGGVFHAISKVDILPHGNGWLADINQAWLAKVQRPWVVIVRPDKIIVSEGKAENAQQMLKDCLQFLG